MDKCYAVTTGEYSDFSVHAVFSTREAAEACAQTVFVQSYGPLDGALDIRDAAQVIELPFNSIGESIQHFRIKISVDDAHIQLEGYTEDHPRRWVSVNFWDTTPMLHITCPARSAEHAIHIATEMRTKLLTLLPVDTSKWFLLFRDDSANLYNALKESLETQTPAPATS